MRSVAARFERARNADCLRRANFRAIRRAHLEQRLNRLRRGWSGPPMVLDATHNTQQRHNLELAGRRVALCVVFALIWRDFQ